MDGFSYVFAVKETEEKQKKSKAKLAKLEAEIEKLNVEVGYLPGVFAFDVSLIVHV